MKPFSITGVHGWLLPVEATALAYLARGGTVLEVGSYEGLSTLCLAQEAKKIVCVDSFQSTGTPGTKKTLDAFQANLERYGMRGKVEIRVGFNQVILPQLLREGYAFDGAFLDSSHDGESVRRDLEMILPLVKSGGWLAFHDYDSPDDPEVAPVIEAWRGGRWLVRTGNLAVLPR